MCTEGIRVTLIGSKNDETIWVYNPYTGWISQPWNDAEFRNSYSKVKKIGTKVVLDKTCDLYEVTCYYSDGREYTGKVALWRCVLLWMESTIDGITSTQTAIKLKIGDIPDKAFTKTLTIDWIDGFVCSGN